MTVLLNQAYAGYQAGTVVVLPAETESALVAQGLASVSSAVPTSGAVTVNILRGRAAMAAGASTLVITCPACTSSSIVFAQVAQTTADGTFTSVLRCTPSNGSFQINGPALATAATQISWLVVV